jgi:hypothetical protein
MEIGADVLIKATKVDGVYDSDPKENPNAVKFDELSYIDSINLHLGVMDSTAVTMCMEHKLPIHVLNLWDIGALKKRSMAKKLVPSFTKLKLTIRTIPAITRLPFFDSFHDRSYPIRFNDLQFRREWDFSSVALALFLPSAIILPIRQ